VYRTHIPVSRTTTPIMSYRGCENAIARTGGEARLSVQRPILVVYYKSKARAKESTFPLSSLQLFLPSQVYLQQNKKKTRAEGNSCHA
jgi:hypothetical protein